MRTVRYNTFETNSSSTHSLAVPKKVEHIPSDVRFHFGDFGWELEDDILETLLSLLSKSNSSCLEVGVVLRYIGTTIEMNKDTIYKMIKMSPEYIYSGRLKELLRKSTEVSVRSVVEVKSEKTLKILSQFLVTGVLSVYSDWLINGCKESIDFGFF